MERAVRTLVLSAVLAGVFAPTIVRAHHSFAMFDLNSPLTMTGTVTAFQWTNPHAYIELDVPGAGGGVQHWTIELGSPSILMQAGWTFKDLKYGDRVTVIVSPLRSKKPGALLSKITMPDGRVLGNGPLPIGGNAK
ncbi:MAG TPA: DUF6152 family protein [Vicinamibacterales bacterium]|nr:DUF6152 family protein [Vicinamibacterales bacterium]